MEAQVNTTGITNIYMGISLTKLEKRVTDDDQVFNGRYY